ncbi:MAG: cation:proton antiporter [Rhodospirillum sp.]|nr:cation:proton antiporter [Rhodospirillum sp.]MCF8488904.1 cation:proton antiporter [Rhodospirillum sp.]MCF8500034.1 cation:proton antiporter [Rhodospirillum sp.]
MDTHTDITGIAYIILIAMGCGLLFTRLRQPAIVGYILCGVLLGPSGLQLVENRGDISLMAELGVLMLLFVIGLELKVSTLMTVWKIALGATVIQVGGSLGVMLLVKDWLGFPLGQAVLLAFALALSSTAVVIKLLEQLGALHTRTGRVVVGVLIAQDMAVAPMIMALNGLAGEGFTTFDAGKVVASMVFLAALVLWLARRPLPMPFAKEATRHKDLVPLAGMAFCFGAAALSGSFGLSAGYGAFLAGLILGNSDQAESFEQGSQPIQAVLLMVFFLSVGLLLDLGFLWDNVGRVIFLVAMVLVFKTLLNIGGLRLLGLDWPRVILSSVMLAQVGEFSFVLTGMGLHLGLLDETTGQLVVAITVLSLAVTPLWVGVARRLGRPGTPLHTLGDVLRGIFGPVRHRMTRTRDRVLRLVTRAAPRPLLAVAEGPPEGEPEGEPKGESGEGGATGEVDRDDGPVDYASAKDRQTDGRGVPVPATPEPKSHA